MTGFDLRVAFFKKYIDTRDENNRRFLTEAAFTINN